MRQPRIYVVRIYRKGARNLAGMVEDARTGKQRPFANLQQLWSSLRLSSFRKAPAAGRTRASGGAD